MIFLDTGFLSRSSRRETLHHPRVVEVFRTFKDLRLVEHLLTTNHVIAETITLTRKIGHEDAARLGDQLYGEKLARIHWASPDEERAAFDYFKRHQDHVLGPNAAHAAIAVATCPPHETECPASRSLAWGP